jgi:hypothetical protein
MDVSKTTKKIKKCSHCGETGHNKRSCPQKPIEDTEKITKRSQTIEEITISDSKEQLISDLLDRQSYDIPVDIFTVWYPQKTTCKQTEIRYLLDKGINKDSIRLYLDIVKEFDEIM